MSCPYCRTPVRHISSYLLEAFLCVGAYGKQILYLTTQRANSGICSQLMADWKHQSHHHCVLHVISCLQQCRFTASCMADDYILTDFMNPCPVHLKSFIQPRENIFRMLSERQSIWKEPGEAELTAGELIILRL